jgi:hypothetical protein
MNINRFTPGKRRLLRSFTLLCGMVLGGTATMPQPTLAQTHHIDILSNQFYSQLQDAWMFNINEQGVAAGYIATQSVNGPFLPTTYHGSGQFQTYGLESAGYWGTVAGMDRHGNFGGNLSDANYDSTPYVVRNGVVEYLPFVPSDYAWMDGMTASGIAYGSYYDEALDQGLIFTYQNGAVQTWSQPYQYAYTGRRMLNDRGLLGAAYYDPDSDQSYSYLFDTATATLTSLEIPAGFDIASLRQITNADLIYGTVYTSDYSDFRQGIWNSDGTFSHYFGIDEGTFNVSAIFNDLGHAISLYDDAVWRFDGAQWTAIEIDGLGDHRIFTLSDFNNRGDFVGLTSRTGSGFLWGFVAQAVPEPTTGSVLGLLLIGSVAVRRHRRNP